jgi:hypothetical protein
VQDPLNLSHNGFPAEQVGDVKAVFCDGVMLAAGNVEPAVVSDIADENFFGLGGPGRKTLYRSARESSLPVVG